MGRVATRICELRRPGRHPKDRRRAAYGRLVEGPLWHRIQRRYVFDASNQNARSRGQTWIAVVPLTIENVQNRTYPLLLEVYFYLDRVPGHAVDPKLKEFLRFVLSRQGQEAIARDGKFLPLTKEAVEEQLRKLE